MARQVERRQLAGEHADVHGIEASEAQHAIGRGLDAGVERAHGDGQVFQRRELGEEEVLALT